MDILKKYKLVIPKKIDEKLPVLLVDDQQDLRMIVAHQLNKRNFNTILYASDALETLECLRSHSGISVMVCNGELSSLSGIDLLSEIREDTRITRPPFCITMSNISKPKLLLAVEAGVDEILVKPFTLGDILPKIYHAFSTFHNPKNPEKLYELAKQKLREKLYDEAAEIYQHLHKSSPKSARPLNGLAKIKIASQDYDAAVKFLELAEKSNPHFVNTFSMRGQIFFERNDIGQGLLWYHKAFDLSPLNPVHYKTCAEILLEKESYEKAIDVLQIALNNKVQFSGIYHLLSQSTYKLKNYEDCIKYIQKELIREPENTTYLRGCLEYSASSLIVWSSSDVGAINVL